MGFHLYKDSNQNFMFPIFYKVLLILQCDSLPVKQTNQQMSITQVFHRKFFYPHLYFKINFAYLQPSDYRKMVEVLLRTATIHRRDLIQRIAIGICNMVVCQVMVI